MQTSPRQFPRVIASILSAAGLVVSVLVLTAPPASARMADNRFEIVVGERTICDPMCRFTAWYEPTVYVYGPKGYYREHKFSWANNSRDRSVKFSGAPYGDYRVRIAWTNGHESNRYGYPFSKCGCRSGTKWKINY